MFDPWRRHIPSRWKNTLHSAYNFLLWETGYDTERWNGQCAPLGVLKFDFFPFICGLSKNIGYDLSRVPWDSCFSVPPAVSHIYTKANYRKSLSSSFKSFFVLSPSLAFQTTPTKILSKHSLPESLQSVSSAYGIFLIIPFLNIPDTFAHFANTAVWHLLVPSHS